MTACDVHVFSFNDGLWDQWLRMHIAHMWNLGTWDSDFLASETQSLTAGIYSVLSFVCNIPIMYTHGRAVSPQRNYQTFILTF